MIVRRFEKNPILAPNKNQSWEAEAVFNACPARKGGRIFLLYRAISLPHYHTLAKTKLAVSDIGIAESKDGTRFYNRRRFVVPEHEWERFGCEDPRVTKFEGAYYIFYTALSSWPPRADTIKVGLAISRDLKRIDEKRLITPFNAKAMALFPERINGKIWAILTVHTDKPPAKICLAELDKKDDLWSDAYWQRWYGRYETQSLELRRGPQDHCEVGAPPIKTKYGWLVFYSHIRNYFSPKRLFGIEAVLLDLTNPRKILARTDFPILVPEEYWERYGLVPNVVFPSGAMLQKHTIFLYYGSADTTCSLALIDAPQFLQKIRKAGVAPVTFQRMKKNPLLAPIDSHPWEARATFNPAALFLDGKIHLVYRAMSLDNTSVLGYATSPDGTSIDYRAPEPIYTPREPFESKLQAGGNSGCEDPRLVKIGETVYLFYTAFDGKNPPRVAMSSIGASDFLNRRWGWSRPALISPPDLDDKDAAMFPEKIKGKYIIIHRNGNDIDLSFHKTLRFDGTGWLEEYRWIAPRPGMWDGKKVGIASPPLKTTAGWIMFYHGVSEGDHVYRVGAVLLSLKDPTKILCRTDYPLLEPHMEYEKKGEVANVVFPCGAVIKDKKVYLYYGGADKIVGGATIDLSTLLQSLKACHH